MLDGVAPLVGLNNGTRIPQIGLGTSPLTDDEVVPVIVSAVEAGYRLIDTAEKYGNETGVGEGIRSCGARREDLFVTTKLDGKFQGADRAVEGLDGSLARLGVDYVDLLLIHWPLPQKDTYVDTWRTFEKLLHAGKARAIGVSNFKPSHLDRLRSETEVVPVVNQIYLNPDASREELRGYNARHGIVTEAYSPLGAGRDLLGRAPIGEIAERHGKTPAQIVLRWQVQLGVVPLPRSRNPARIAANIDVFDFELDTNDLAALAALDQGEGAAPDSDQIGH